MEPTNCSRCGGEALASLLCAQCSTVTGVFVSSDAAATSPPKSDDATFSMATRRADTVVSQASAKAAEYPEIAGYEVLKPLGAGGMGDVFLARDVILDRLVAIKTIRAGSSSADESRVRFRREARAMAAVDHPNVVRIYSFGSLPDGKQYLVMEYVEGETLRDVIRRQGRLSTKEALTVVRQVIYALETVREKKIIHRDIKPQNILIDHKGVARVLDFGLAKAAEQSPSSSNDDVVTHDDHLVGTPHYISPEQALGQRVDYRSDIYSLGIVLYELLTGERPFNRGGAMAIVASHINETVKFPADHAEGNEAVALLVERMAAKSPSSRPDYSEIQEAIDNIIGPPSWGSTPVVFREPSVFARAWSAVSVPIETAMYFALLSANVLIVSHLAMIPRASQNAIAWRTIAIALVVVAGVVMAMSIAISRLRRRLGSRILKFVVASLPAAAAIGATLVLLHRPMQRFEAIEPVSQLVSIGGVPDRDALLKLKREGYRGVVSLFHPAVFPSETILMARLKREASEVGIEYVDISILPWDSSSDAGKAIESLLLMRPGRYYIQAAEGDNRLEVVRQTITRLAQSESSGKRLYTPATLRLERGTVQIIENGKFLTPFPTADEMRSFILASRIRHVVSLLDPALENNASFLAQEERFCRENGIRFRHFPLGGPNHDARRALDAAMYVRSIAPPAVVHGFFVPPQRNDAAAESFLLSYKSGKRALAPSLFSAPMKRGRVQLLAAHIAAGPRPTGPEFGGQLVPKGIAEFIYLSDKPDDAMFEDSRITGEHKLKWRVLSTSDETLPTLLEQGGPYYLYGPGLERVESAIRKRFQGHLLPPAEG